MITVKISSRGSGKNLDISQYLGHPNRWGNCEFHVNTDLRVADVWFISEDADDDDVTCQVRDGGLIFVTAETSWPVGHYGDHPERLDILSQFDRVLTPHDVYLPHAQPSLPFLPWMINANHGPSINRPHDRDLRELERMSPPDKRFDLSVFCSIQSSTPEHRMRTRFVDRLAAHFGDRLHWYGNGVNPVSEKWEGLAQYRSTIVLENRSTPRIITEKLADAYLAYAYPFYWGASDVADYVPADSLTALDIRDLQGAIETIEVALDTGLPERALPAMSTARLWVLHEWNPYARMADIAEEIAASAAPYVERRVRTMASVDTQSQRHTGRLRAGAFARRVRRLI